MKPEAGIEQDARVEKLWKILDAEKKGRIDAVGLRRGLKRMDHRMFYTGLPGYARRKGSDSTSC
jgi:hypothetical protein